MPPITLVVNPEEARWLRYGLEELILQYEQASQESLEYNDQQSIEEHHLCLDQINKVLNKLKEVFPDAV